MHNFSFKLLGGMAAAAMLAAGFSSCTNEMDHHAFPEKTTNLLVQSPKIEAYSGNTYWGQNLPMGTRSSDTQANQWYMTWDCYPPVDLTEDDINEIKRRLSFNGEKVENKVIIPFENYWVQQVYKGTDEYIPTDINGDPCTGISILGSGQMDHLEDLDKNGNSERIENFEQGNNHSNPGLCQGCGKSLAGTTLKTDMATGNIDPTTQFKYLESYGSSFYNNYYFIEYNGYYYLGFDYEMHKQAFNQNEAKDVERDYNFTDWIVRVVPAYGIGATPLDNPGGIQPGDKYDGDGGGNTGGNTGGGDNGDDNGNGNDNDNDNDNDNGNGTGNGGVTPPAVGGDNHRNEVEANLGFDDKNGKYPESHLSIHVRSANDVEMFIPMKLKYVCPADDMEIVQKHLDGLMDHGGQIENGTYDKDGKLVMASGLLSKMTYTVGDENQNWQVSLYVEYVAAGYTSSHNNETFDQEGIHIWTEGINADMMDYLFEKFGDGITFEIWNYYDEEASFDELKGYLNQTTIKFLGDNLPDYFINAFGSANHEVDKDCDIHVEESQAGDYEFVGTGPHLNGSAYNDIYKNKASDPGSEE